MLYHVFFTEGSECVQLMATPAREHRKRFIRTTISQEGLKSYSYSAYVKVAWLARVQRGLGGRTSVPRVSESISKNVDVAELPNCGNGIHISMLVAHIKCWTGIAIHSHEGRCKRHLQPQQHLYTAMPSCQ